MVYMFLPLKRHNQGRTYGGKQVTENSVKYVRVLS